MIATTPIAKNATATTDQNLLGIIIHLTAPTPGFSGTAVAAARNASAHVLADKMRLYAAPPCGINGLELVDLTRAGWNQLTTWLRRLDEVRRAS